MDVAVDVRLAPDAKDVADAGRKLFLNSFVEIAFLWLN